MTLPSLNFGIVGTLTAMRNYILGVLPPGVEVIRGQGNRTPEPQGADFVVMTPMHQRRLSFNVDIFVDCSFVASINTPGVLNVTEMLLGTITVGTQLLGVPIPSGTYVTGTLSGTGGVGTYQLSGTFGTLAGTKLATGVFLAMTPMEITIQLDVHGPNSSDNAHVISSLFRDQYAVDQFATFGTAPPGWDPIPPGGTLGIVYNAIAPLYADEPRQMPFINAEQQYEDRWIIDACVQTNQIVTVSQEFADTLDISLLEVTTMAES